MAKRGYRGKHPNDDMKVAPTSHKAVNSDKLTAEYNKVGTKNKYDYIKSHDGFYPQGSAIIIANGGSDAWDTQTISIISTDGTSIEYTGASGAEDTTANEFESAGAIAVVATSLCDCINADEGHGGKILCTDPETGTITLTQVEPGPDGNTTFVNGLTGGTIPAGFTGG